jgi:hypothetical protein
VSGILSCYSLVNRLTLISKILLRSDVLPIVMGARPEDYKALLPPDSYIHVDDFQSPKHLAEYLHVLDKNDTLYNSYFRWKDSWIPVINRSTCNYSNVLKPFDCIARADKRGI